MVVQSAAIIDILLFSFSRNGCTIGGHLDSIVFHLAQRCAIGGHVCLRCVMAIFSNKSPIMHCDDVTSDTIVSTTQQLMHQVHNRISVGNVFLAVFLQIDILPTFDISNSN